MASLARPLTERERAAMNRLTASCLLAASTSLLASCGSLAPVTRPYSALQPTGFFDVGAGYGRLRNVEGSKDADGIVVSFKAYPAGRWYGELKDSPMGGALPAEVRASMDVIADLSESDRVTAVTTEAGLASVFNFDRQGLPAARQNAKHIRTLETLLSGSAGDKVPAQGRRLIRSAIDANRTLSDGERMQMRAVASVDDEPTNAFYVVEERANLLNRFSVFYGVSAGNFSTSDFGSSINTIGIGFDVSPELALIAGRGFYDGDDDSDSAFFFGVSLNLNAFRSLMSSVAAQAN